MTRSATYAVVVRHQRTSPRAHRVQHRMRWWLLDLDELADLDRTLPGFGWNRPALTSFHDRDHLGRDDRPVREKVTALLADHGVAVEGGLGTVLLLTLPRSLGYVFNPVSFWWCHRPDGTLAAVVAEVANTFGEARPQVLVPGPDGEVSAVLRTAHPKELHVSPFVDLDCTYRYRISARPGRRVATAIEVVAADGTTVLHTSAAGARHPLGRTAAVRHAVSLAPVRVTAAIHAHALRLWRAGVPFRHRPPYRSDIGSLPAPVPSSVPAPASGPAPVVAPARGEPVTATLLPVPAIGAPPRPLVALGRRALMALLAGLPHGQLTLVLPDGSRHRYGPDDTGARAEVRVLDERFLVRLVQRPRLAFGEGRTADEWRSDDLPTCLALLHETVEAQRRRPAVAALTAAQERRPRLPRRRPGQRTGRGEARSHIAYHYDLGNELYRRMLDPTMAYSSAWFTDPDQTLEDAQVAKFERLCERLALDRGSHLLEVGCGWGGLAVHAAVTRGCRVDAVTLSHQQAVEARARVAAAGVADLVTVVESDYRDVEGRYDAIVSVEMVEAVGHDLETFFGACDRLLAPGGTMTVQAITKPDQRDRRTRSVDDGWVERYIFPGSLISSVSGLTGAAARGSGLVLGGADEFGASYARTLAEWRSRFAAHRSELAALGYDESFARTWDYYLATAEAGFRTGYLRVFHLDFARVGPPAPTPARSRPVDRSGAPTAGAAR